MKIEIRPMELSDLSEVVSGWNNSLTFDQVSEDRFKSVILNDPNHEKSAALVAIHNGKIAGLIISVVRKGIQGADSICFMLISLSFLGSGKLLANSSIRPLRMP